MGAHSKSHTILFGRESTFGTKVTADKDFGLIQSFSPRQAKELNKQYTSGDFQVQSFVNNVDANTFDIEAKLQHGRPLELITGGTVVHAETTGDWRHTFALATDLPSFTIEDSFNLTADLVDIYLGAKFAEATIRLDTDDVLFFAGNGITKDVDNTELTASAAVVSNITPLHFKNSTLSVGAEGAETNVGALQSFSITLARETEGIKSAGQDTISAAVAKNLDISFEFQIYFENKTQYNSFDTTADLGLIFNANNGITLGNGRRELNVDLSECRYGEYERPVNLNEYVYATFRGSGKYEEIFMVDNISSTAF